MTDPEPYARYRDLARASVTAHGGKYLVRGGRIEAVEGDPDTDRFVVLEFSDVDAARDWYNSADYQAALPLRLASADTRRLFFIEGYEPE